LLVFSLYLLPFALVGAALGIGVSGLVRKECDRLSLQLDRTQTELRQLKEDRDLALQELFRRFSEEGKLNKERNQFQAQLAEYEKYAALAQLALGAAHEINNPLLGILSHLELELNSARGEPRAEIEQCIAGTKRIASTLRSLMNYARPGPLVLSKVNLHRLVTDTLAFLQHQPMLHSRILESHVSPDLPAIRVDANQLSQVLMNLLLNAAQATPEGGHITVSATRSPSEEVLEIQVTDTGCGISPEVLPHVFEPFFTTKRGKGTGLGLSISQTYVRNHHGEIQIESQMGTGTTVRITLPILQPEPIQEKQTPEEVIIQ
jgi:signal transduction histidine kinase